MPRIINAVAPYEGVIEWRGEPKEGTSQSGNKWANVDFVLKYLNHNMREELMLFTLSGPDKVSAFMELPIGTEVSVSWRPTAVQYTTMNGDQRWFAQNSAFNVCKLDGVRRQPAAQNEQQQYRQGQQTQQAQQQATQPRGGYQPDDDLPY